MNLERIETLCLNYLEQVTNPVVPLEKLLDYCLREVPGEHLTIGVLLQFLRSHDQIEVLEGPTEGEKVDLDTFAAVGLAMGPRAVLKARIPDGAEMRRLMQGQLDSLRDRLELAAKAAFQEKDRERMAQIDAMLERLDDLRDRLSS